MNRGLLPLALVLAMSGATPLAGCGQGQARSSDADRQTAVILRIVATEYGEYLSLNGGVPPKDAATFRKFLESRLADLDAYNVKNVDEILKSPRDGQPLVIVCGKRIAPPDSPDMPWAAYEQTGVNGKRMAVIVRGGSRELSDEELSSQITSK